MSSRRGSWLGYFFYYLPAWIWLGIAVIVLVTWLSMGSKQFERTELYWVQVALGGFRAFQAGWRPRGWNIWSIVHIAIIITLWPFMEIYHQVRFLWQARGAWARGEVLINERTSKPVRAA